MTRHHALRLVILLLAAANIFGLYLGLTQRAMLISMCLRLSDVWPIYLASPVATLLGLGGLWSQRRWGAWLCIGMGIVVLGLELYGCGPAAHVMRIPLALAVLSTGRTTQIGFGAGHEAVARPFLREPSTTPRSRDHERTFPVWRSRRPRLG